MVNTICSVLRVAMTPPSPIVASLPRDVIQRNGERTPFDAVRIQSAIARAGQATGEFGDDEARLLTAQATEGADSTASMARHRPSSRSRTWWSKR